MGSQEYIYFMGSVCQLHSIPFYNIYTLWGRNRFFLPVTYFPKNLVYPFNLRVCLLHTFRRISTCYILSDEQGTPFYSTSNAVYPFTLRVADEDYFNV